MPRDRGCLAGRSFPRIKEICEMLMKRLLLGAVLLGSGVVMLAQQAAAPAVVEPEYANEVELLGSDGKLTPLDRQTPHVEAKSSNYVFKVKMQGRESIPGTQSTVRVGTQPVFVVKAHLGDTDPSTLIHLYKLDIGKNERYYVMSDASATAFSGGKSSMTPQTVVPLTIVKYGESSFKITPAQPLVPGEYVFPGLAGTAFCFGVDAK